VERFVVNRVVASFFMKGYAEGASGIVPSEEVKLFVVDRTGTGNEAP